MYLRALNNGLLVLDPGVEFLSIDNLPTIVTVNNSCTNYGKCNISIFWAETKTNCRHKDDKRYCLYTFVLIIQDQFPPMK